MRCLFFWSIAKFPSRTCSWCTQHLFPFIRVNLWISFGFIFHFWQLVCLWQSLCGWVPTSPRQHVFLMAIRVSYFREGAHGLEPALDQISLTLAATAVEVSENFSMCLFWALPKSWPSQASLSVCVRCMRHRCQHTSRAIFTKEVMEPNTGSSVSKEDTAAVSKGYWLPYGRELWVAKTGLRYYCVSVGSKNRQQMLGSTGVMK